MFAKLLVPLLLSAPLAGGAFARPAGDEAADHALLQAYVQRVVDATSGGVLPEHGPASQALLDALLLELHAATGLLTWCGVGFESVVGCGSTEPWVNYQGSTPGFCALSSFPGEAYRQVASLAATHQGPWTAAHYVVFHDVVDGVSLHTFPVSQPAPQVGLEVCWAPPNSTGASARTSASGSTSLAANELVLRAEPVPDSTGLFFLGTEFASAQPFGDGLLCTAGSLLRLPAGTASGNVLTYAPDLASPVVVALGLAPGSWVYVQAWYRDPAAGGAGFNLSSGLALTLCP